MLSQAEVLDAVRVTCTGTRMPVAPLNCSPYPGLLPPGSTGPQSRRTPRECSSLVSVCFGATHQANCACRRIDAHQHLGNKALFKFVIYSANECCTYSACWSPCAVRMNSAN